MQSNSDQVGNTIKELIEVCRDGQEGFKTAAEAVNDPALQAEFRQYSEQRRQFASELEGAMAATGRKIEEPGTSLSGTLHRGWINLRQTLAGNDEKAVLSECERGEDSAVETYRKARQAGLPQPIREMVEMEYADVQRVHDRVRSLRNQWKAAG
jgi:uncharacterized protein (TIGR02284 family)